jgi:general secretion pathway protein D
MVTHYASYFGIGTLFRSAETDTAGRGVMYRLALMLLGCFLVVVMSSTPPTADAADRQAPSEQTTAGQGILLNFRDVDIRQLITLMSNLTGKAFLVDNAVRGTVTLVAPSPMRLEDAYQVFLSVLESQGFTAVSQGPITKIIPSTKAKTSPLSIRD